MRKSPTFLQCRTVKCNRKKNAQFIRVFVGYQFTTQKTGIFVNMIMGWYPKEKEQTKRGHSLLEIRSSRQEDSKPLQGTVQYIPVRKFPKLSNMSLTAISLMFTPCCRCRGRAWDPRSCRGARWRGRRCWGWCRVSPQSRRGGRWSQRRGCPGCGASTCSPGSRPDTPHSCGRCSSLQM